MSADIAILAGSGSLPEAVHQALPEAWIVTFEGVPVSISASNQTISARFEKLGSLFNDLRAKGVTRLVLAGAMARPQLDPSKLDPFMLSILPSLMEKLSSGDDTLLRYVIHLFETEGFAIVPASDVVGNLLMPQGPLVGKMDDYIPSDLVKADRILSVTAELDIGQAVVVEQGAVLGVETLQGTDALLGNVAGTSKQLRPFWGRGILVKRPKIGQDLRIDMPALGPKTVEAAAQAGLTAIIATPHHVLLLEREKTLDLARARQIAILGVDSQS